MGTDRAKAKSFTEWYKGELPRYQKAAVLAQDLVREAIDAHNVESHLILARPKALHSIRDKLRRKTYSDPQIELTDKVGVRVVVYYEDDVDRVAAILANRLEKHPSLCVDKRDDLKPNEFGYRSFHLIVRLCEPEAKMEAYGPLRGEWFEVQIRTVLEHAWAEIEHEVIYKSGIERPSGLTRRFAAVAGTLEILDREFCALRGAGGRLVELYVPRIRSGAGLADELDTSRLHATLEIEFPNGRSYRSAKAGGTPFPPGSDALALRCLRESGVLTVADFASLLRSSELKGALQTYASLTGLAPLEVSHLGVLALATCLKDSDALEEFLEDFSADSAFVAALGRR